MAAVRLHQFESLRVGVPAELGSIFKGAGTPLLGECLDDDEVVPDCEQHVADRFEVGNEWVEQQWESVCFKDSALANRRFGLENRLWFDVLGLGIVG